MDLRPVALALVVSAACHGHEAAPAMRHEARVFAGGVAPAAEGERTFGVMNCDGCHGGGAVGWVGPSLRDGRWRYGGADGDIFQSIYYGQPHGMPAYGGLLPPTAIWKLVTYLQSLEPPANVPTESWR